MDKIIFPLKQRMKGPEVANLQDALQFLLDRKALMADDKADPDMPLKRDR